MYLLKHTASAVHRVGSPAFSDSISIPCLPGALSFSACSTVSACSTCSRYLLASMSGMPDGEEGWMVGKATSFFRRACLYITPDSLIQCLSMSSQLAHLTS